MDDRTPSPEELRAEIRRLVPWHHDLEIAPGVRTGERAADDDRDPLGVASSGLLRPDEVLGPLLRDIFPNGLEGRSMLDCGCNAGGYLFAAKRMGAGQCFGFDVREHWLNQARFLARHLPGEDVEFAQLDLLALRDRARERNLEPFDVTLFFGLFYHLPDPVAGVRIAADLTRELLILNTDADPKLTGDALTLNLESDTALMSGVHRLAWLPTGPRVLEEILHWCGFPHTRVHYVRQGPRFPRIQVLAARDARTFAHYDGIHPPRPRRATPLWKRAARRLLGR
jgi:tRNA (mo5U34)-methyltransferase